MKKVLIGLGALIFVTIGIILFNTFTFKSKQLNTDPQPLVKVGSNAVANLQQAIQFKTISYDDVKKTDTIAFKNFHEFLKKAYPLVFSKLEVETVNNLSLILHWKAQNTNKKPIVLMAHQDVVPVEDATIAQWDADPFSGTVKNEMVYGRGTIDDKGSLIAILESAELLLSQGFTPQSDIFFVFGHDEEISGLQGSKVIAQLFENRKIIPAFVLDEGGIITNYKVPGLKKPAAVVGIAEKGYQTLELKVNIPGGHSSMPEKQTAIDALAKAVVLLKENPFPAEINSIVSNFLSYVGPEMPFVNKMAMANQWLFKPLILSSYSKSPAGDATIRTTTATTIFQAGVKENIVPGEAKAIVNFRTLPGVSKEMVINHVREIIDNPKIQIHPVGAGNAPNQVADLNDPGFQHIQQTIAAHQQNIVVTPYLVLGATDGRYFGGLTNQVFRFIPFTDPEGFHGVNERIKISDFKKGISFYYYLLKNYK